MRNKQYTTRPIRIDDNNWKKLKDLKTKSGLSWNLFIKELLTKSNDRL